MLALLLTTSSQAATLNKCVHPETGEVTYTNLRCPKFLQTHKIALDPPPVPEPQRADPSPARPPAPETARDTERPDPRPVLDQTHAPLQPELDAGVTDSPAALPSEAHPATTAPQHLQPSTPPLPTGLGVSQHALPSPDTAPVGVSGPDTPQRIPPPPLPDPACDTYATQLGHLLDKLDQGRDAPATTRAQWQSQVDAIEARRRAAHCF